ncbi:MAG: hypothetical protein IKG67_01290 [Parasporobacterium sp.]|nr:hypothetical protein [Parasporobacterium sp.]
MTVLYIILIIVALALAALFTFKRAAKTNEYSLLLKSAASVAFIVLGCVALRGSSGAVSFAVIPGLVMGLVGDIYLDLKYVYPKTSTLYTFTGFGAFILGHIFYLIFQLRQYGPLSTGLIISIIVGVLAGIGIYATPKLMKLDYGSFRIISAAYAALLVFLTVYALCVMIAHFSAASLLFFLGILLFLFSDLVLSQIYFGEGKNTPQYSIINHASYYLGQILIAASLFFL